MVRHPGLDIDDSLLALRVWPVGTVRKPQLGSWPADPITGETSEPVAVCCRGGERSRSHALTESMRRNYVR